MPRLPLVKGYLPILECGPCGHPTRHVKAYQVTGRVERGEVDGAFRMKQMVEIDPTPGKWANAVELLYMCTECQALRRWGLEVADAEAGRSGVGGSVRGEGRSEGDGAEPREEPLVPEESVEAWAERVRPRAQGGGETRGA